VRRVVALSTWCFALWVLLTWTLTLEQLLVGAGVAVAVGLALAPTGPVAPPWRLLRPAALLAIVRLLAGMVVHIVVANLKLTRRIWLPSRPLASGMVVVPTRARSEAGLTGVGLLTSLVVDNQLVDVDASRHELLFHAVDVPPDDPDAAYDQVNGPVERLLLPLEGR
jgi:multicomponent Na+:H+ antiporter subunit E